VAGSFYPSDPDDLARTVDRLLAGATPRLEERPWGLIVPHAGYQYSGPVAASAYATLRPWIGEIARVAILGPAHFAPVRGCAIDSARAWRTPLGEAVVDPEQRDVLIAAGGAVVDDGAHEAEHSIEVQLPFLQRLLGHVLRFVPIAVGGQTGAETALRALDRWADLVVVSTDLSHFHDAGTARALDRRTADAVVALDPSAIGPGDACGGAGLRGLLVHARRDGRRVELLDLRTSADTAGDPDRVVGYGAFAICRAEARIGSA
jgi:hypothetical protein